MIDEKERWTAKRLKLALRVADAHVKLIDAMEHSGSYKGCLEEAKAFHVATSFTGNSSPRGGQGRRRRARARGRGGSDERRSLRDVRLFESRGSR